jgi:hypothetical protein
MRTIELVQVPNNIKIGDRCTDLPPNITEDTIFTVDGKPIGFYLKTVGGKLKSFVEVANAEFISDRVPKTQMSRGPQGNKAQKKARADAGIELVTQYSTILGSVPPKPHMRRNYPSMSSVHQVKSAQTFVKAMLLACREAEETIRDVTPNIYEEQERIINENVPPQWRFGRLFTSSISNSNIAVQYHRDALNLQGCVNVILAKKRNAKGGNTTIPDYAATVDSSDNSMLVYPAWRNVHGVTPIRPTAPDGYRNSLVFYPLKAFKNYW